MTPDPGCDATWPDYARRLAELLADLGKLTDPAWRAAVSATPRHHLVPRYWTQDATGGWESADTRVDPPPQWLERVYSNSVLISEVQHDGTTTRLRSSSSQPGLMIRMLEALEIRGGHRVLETGTGTGYNAALLSHQLGSDLVFTIDTGQREATGRFDPVYAAFMDLRPAACGRSSRKLTSTGFSPIARVGHDSV